MDEYLGTPEGSSSVHEPTHDREAAYEFDIEAPVPALEVRALTGREQNERRANAKAALDARLAVMSHDKLVETLQTVVASEFCDYYARKEAQRRLTAHQASCGVCKPVTK